MDRIMLANHPCLAILEEIRDSIKGTSRHNQTVAAWGRINTAVDMIDDWIKQGKVLDDTEMLQLRKVLTGR